MRLGIGFGLGRKRGGSLVQQAIAILRKYGTNAHVYLPGIGTVSELTAGNYLDSAGTTAASVDNPVGLSLDALQAMTLGTDVTVNGAFSTDTNWIKAANWTIGGGVATSNGGVGALRASIQPLVFGKNYLMTFTIKRYVSGSMYYPYSGTGGAAAPTAVGTYSWIHQAGTTDLYLYSNSFSGDIDDVTVREIPGIHATQATTANKPILRQSGGKYSWQFDGSNDSLSLSAPLFQMSDDHAVITSIAPDAINAFQVSANPAANTATSARCAAIYTPPGSVVNATWTNDAATVFLVTAGTISVNEKAVITASNRSGSCKARKNGGNWSSAVTPTGVFTLNTGQIGSGFGLAQYSGSMGASIAIKGTVTDADLLTLERFVGQLSGVSI